MCKRLLWDTEQWHGRIRRIDEVHMLVGAGSVSRAGGSGLDISNLLKPPLARGELQCIGATTLDDHRKYIERDAALERRFQPVLVAEPTQAQALDILHGLQVCARTPL
jgi:ATP-dependent Clp protease ATP-binding subunit ClpC